MANYTEHYNFVKPLETENYDVEVANTNSSIADNILYSKVDKIPGKELSTNDFTNAYKKKIDSMQTLYRFKSSVETINDLSSIENKNIGDVYKCKSDSYNYCWNGEEWVNIGTDSDFSEILEKLEGLGNNTGDSLPIGTIVEYDGTTVPERL